MTDEPWGASWWFPGHFRWSVIFGAIAITNTCLAAMVLGIVLARLLGWGS